MGRHSFAALEVIAPIIAIGLFVLVLPLEYSSSGVVHAWLDHRTITAFRTTKRTTRTPLLHHLTSVNLVNQSTSEVSAFAPSCTKEEDSRTPRPQTTTTTTTASTSTITTSSTLGDIMSGLVTANTLPTTTTTTTFGTTTKNQTTTSLAAAYGITHPLNRMALTANGNLQRLVSSYYDAPVAVQVDYCQARGTSTSSSSSTSSTTTSTPAAAVLPHHIWDRRVHLTVYNQTFCVATSEIVVHDAACQALVESGQVGLGQLFRFLDVLPTFDLHDGGPLLLESTGKNGGFWRDYTLECPELSCRIREEFVAGMWELSPVSTTIEDEA